MKSAGVLLLALSALPAYGFPNFVRLGYQHCVSCHISPQRGGLLYPYGRSIDEGESLRGGEYNPSNLWGERITQDVRATIQERISTSTGQPILGKARARGLFRNATELGAGVRISQ